MLPHPEGGWFKETYRSGIKQKFPGFESDRNLATSILFMLSSGNFSTWHTIKSDEIWYHQYGANLIVHCIYPDGKYQKVNLGVGENAQLQFVVPAGTLFGSTVTEKNTFAVVGCMVAPGFDFNDFEMPSYDSLLKKYPKLHQELSLLNPLNRSLG
jgi:predicted cupin superfamily sugar epimerase